MAGTEATGTVTLIFDEIDAGIGGTVGDVVGALMKQLGQSAQVLAVTHLRRWQPAAISMGGAQDSGHRPRAQRFAARHRRGPRREIARMLGGERLSGTAHAQALLQAPPRRPAPRARPSVDHAHEPRTAARRGSSLSGGRAKGPRVHR
jgi:DNA repair protein RecN (Recombination protein N)